MLIAGTLAILILFACAALTLVNAGGAPAHNAGGAIAVRIVAASPLAQQIMRADGGDAQAQRQMAQAYLAGEGVSRDVDVARVWAHAAAQGGDAEGQYLLATLMRRDASRDAQDAVAWFARAAEAIHQAIQDNPDIANLSHQVITENTPQGLRIQLVDQDGRPMFQQGSNEPMPYAKKLLTAVGAIVATLPNRVSISGHTSGNDAPSAAWDLSSNRANQARALLQTGGLGTDRIYEVAGKAGSEPLLPEDPNASANRRLSILLMREAPPVPAHTGLN
jgi:flagellar motor protein MotB